MKVTFLLKLFQFLNWIAKFIPFYIKEQAIHLKENPEFKKALSKNEWEDYKKRFISFVSETLYQKRVAFLKEKYTQKQLDKYGVTIAEQSINIDATKCPTSIVEELNNIRV